MDPSTTLVAFLFQACPSVHSVSLIGSWDNFTTPYALERDSRRGQGQWKGCYSFGNIVCDGDGASTTNKKRHGGLKMGLTYYYYYEINGSIESHDPVMPTTTACPYLPGQTVNSLYVPMERSLRQRSASLSSMRSTDFKTVDPQAKYITPRRPPPIPFMATNSITEPTAAPAAHRRLATAPDALRQRSSSSRSLSPAPAWRRLFSRRRHQSVDEDVSAPQLEQSFLPLQRPTTSGRSPSSHSGRSRTSTLSSEGSRSREISPESLRRFLSDDTAPLPSSMSSSSSSIDTRCAERPSLFIPENIAEENEDDENFATSASTFASYNDNEYTHSPLLATILSPPPFKRTWSSESTTTTTAPLTVSNLSTLTLATARPTSQQQQQLPGATEESTGALLPSTLPKLNTSNPSSSPTCFLSTPSSIMSPSSSFSATDMNSFFDESQDDDESQDEVDDLEYHHHHHHDDGSRGLGLTPLGKTAGGGYTLPRSDSTSSNAVKKVDGQRDDAAGSVDLLRTSFDAGFDDFASELSWMVSRI